MLVGIENWLATHNFRQLTEVAIHTWIQLVGQLGIMRAGIGCIGVGHSGAVGIGCPSGTLVVKALIGPGSSLGIHGWVILACSGILCVRVGGAERIVCSCTNTISIKALLCHNDIFSAESQLVSPVVSLLGTLSLSRWSDTASLTLCMKFDMLR